MTRKRNRYAVRETIDKDGIREFVVTANGEPEWQGVGVWVSAGGVRCVECSGRLTAMLASCPHTAAVKRLLAKESQ